MWILLYGYVAFALIFAVLACIEGMSHQLPMTDRLVGFALSLVWPLPLIMVAIAVIREKKAAAATSYSVTRFSEEPAPAIVHARVRTSRRS
jgi:hypothetical protein